MKRPRIRIKFGRKKWGRRNDRHLHDYEARLILAHAEMIVNERESGRSFTVFALMSDKPDRYDKKNLTKALKRMRNEGLIDGTKGRSFLSGVYILPRLKDKEAA